MEKENLFLAQDFLSDIELYYTPFENVKGNTLSITGEECKHITRVMRHQVGDKLYVTDGKGSIYLTEISSAEKSEVLCDIKETSLYDEQLPNITICIPRLRSQDRFEFALEKCIELGITNFIVYTADRSVAKGEKLDRWNKIALSAMKQSLRSFIPKIEYEKSLSKILNRESNIVYFDQNSENLFKENISQIKLNNSNVFIFGPEGGISEKELELLNDKCNYQLTGNRLRAETAITTVASLISII